MYRNRGNNLELNVEFVNVMTVEREARRARDQYVAQAAKSAAERLKVGILTVLNRAFAGTSDDVRGGVLR